MPRPTPRTLSALATTMTRVLEVLVAAGQPVESFVRTALEDVQRMARGEPISKTTLTAAWKRIEARSDRARGWSTELEKRYHWAVGETATVVRMAATGEDYHEHVLRQGAYGLVGGDDDDRVLGWYRAALAASTLADTPPRPRRVDPNKAAAEAKALARIAKALGKKGKLVAAKQARHDPRKTADAATLKRLLARHRYPSHASVLAFERAFGGLVIPEDGGAADPDWFENDEATLVGAYGCLKSDAHEHPDGGRQDLVPVAYTPNDCILFLDKAGTPYFQDTIEDDTAVKLRGTAAGAVARLLERFG
ncbi:MAG: hypothetical protein IPQ07_08955 [Myxococcales bacterium]|nr:hypothetical protein [Myxococcales bacterium]